MKEKPEKIWISNYVLEQLINDVQIISDKSMATSNDNEYIRKDIHDKKMDEAYGKGYDFDKVTKHIREVYEKYENEEFNHIMVTGIGDPKIDYLLQIITDHRQAIKKDLGEDEEKEHDLVGLG